MHSMHSYVYIAICLQDFQFDQQIPMFSYTVSGMIENQESMRLVYCT